MESIGLFGVGYGSLYKLPFYKPSSSSAIFMVPSTSRLCLNVSKPLFPELICTDNGLSLNLNVRYKLLARCCGNEHSEKKNQSDEKRDALKSLLCLTQSDEKNSSISATKNEALKMAVAGKYNEASSHMKHLFNGDADEAYEARFAHLQILIHIDEYKEALKFLEEGNFPPSKAFDARHSLYQAVVHTMLGNDVDAKRWWKTFVDIDNDNGNSSNFLITAKSLLKPLLSLKPLKPKTDLCISINPAKNKALEAVLNGKHNVAKRHMEDLLEREEVKNFGEMKLNAQLAYIQILIYLDEYEDAQKRLNNIEYLFPPSDPRLFLYKAIGLTALGEHEKAKYLWEAFISTIGELFDPNDED